MMIRKATISFTLVLLFVMGCRSASTLSTYGAHFQRHQDYESLQKVVELTPIGTDKGSLQKVLGEPIDMGFDYRYLIDSVGPKGCSIGAVFHFDEYGKVDDKWLDEICE